MATEKTLLCFVLALSVLPLLLLAYILLQIFFFHSNSKLYISCIFTMLLTVVGFIGVNVVAVAGIPSCSGQGYQMPQ